MTKFEPDKMDWRENPEELSDALIRTATIGQEVILWQVIDSRRVVVKAFVHHVMEEHEIIVLKIPNDLKGFKSELAFYVKLNDRDTLFSTNMVKRQKDKLFLCFPDRYRIKENRENQRISCEDGNRVKVVMRKIEEDILGRSQFDFRLTDISTTGLGVSIGLSKYDSLKSTKQLEIISIGQSPITKPILVHIINLSKQGEGINKFLKIGLKFEETLPKDFIHQIF